jgi:hypothetical protein
VLSENLIKVNKKWRGEDLKLASPPLEEEVVEAFVQLGIPLARDAAEVFSTLGGFSEDDLDSECLTFWTVEKILRENDFNAEDVYFADFLLYSHEYYFKFKDVKSSVIYVRFSETDRVQIADSFDEFFELYLTNIKGLFP